MHNQKTCRDCKQLKLVSCFHRDRTNRDGLNARCKDCMREYKAKWQSNKKQHNAIYTRLWKQSPEEARRFAFLSKVKPVLELIVKGSRVCSNCEKTLPLDAFAKTIRGSIPRYAARCRDCLNAYSSKYKKSEKGRRARRLYAQKHPEHRREMKRRYEKKYPERTRAQKSLRHAIKNGKLCRQPCQVCGDEQSHGHHWSYAKEHRLNVIWLCCKHHNQIHSDGFAYGLEAVNAWLEVQCGACV